MPTQTPIRTPVTEAAPPHSLRHILVVDDDAANRRLLERMLACDGYEVTVAASGQEALEAFELQRPDMVLLDVQMPRISGYDVARQIKRLAGDSFVPVIFLTAATDEQRLAECIACGGDDFLGKPYNRILLRSKIDAFARLRQSHAQLQATNEELASHHEQILTEQEIAKKIYTKIVHSGILDSPWIKYLISPTAIFNGDMLLAAQGPDGSASVLLGDFTGHGLPATIGTMPVSDVFYAMTEKGCSIADIVLEVNRKLKEILPVGLFFASCFYRLDLAEMVCEVFNAGSPDVLVVHPDHGIRHRFVSSHLPLGILSSERVRRRTEQLRLVERDRIYSCSDGLVESFNARESMYGQERLERLLGSAAATDTAFERVIEDLERFRAGARQSDDLTLIEVDVSAARRAREASGLASADARQTKHSGEWSCELTLDADMIRSTDPLPLLMQMVLEVQGVHAHREKIFVILSELYSNSLDHGLLGLDSQLKSTAEGFSAYYEKRERNLQSLSDAFIRVGVRNEPREDGRSGYLHITIEDSGPGFDTRHVGRQPEDATGKSGRGIFLVRSLCQSLRYNDRGNRAEAIYRW